jgi:alkylation response protein AidB-like acyl-CoA dehydrogenase
MFVLPVKQEGVTVRPLVQMTGESEFNEVFLDEARIPKGWTVGEINGGWRTAVALLAHERRQTGVGSMSGSATQRSKAGRNPIPVAQLTELASGGSGRDDEATEVQPDERRQDSLVRQDLARLHSGERIVAFLRSSPGVHPSVGKLWRTRQGRAAADLAGRLAFPASPAWPEDEPSGDGDYFSFQILNCRGMSIGGGTDEIQRNTLGERALGLPREPSVDRDMPFRDLPKN